MRQFRLRIACAAVKADGSNFESFDLFWYRKRSTNGTIENLGPGDRQQNEDMERIVLSGIQGLNSALFSEDMPGDYWCQGVVTNGSEQIMLAPSQVLTVLRPEDYAGRSMCSSVQSDDVITCANDTQSPPLLLASSSPSPSPPSTSVVVHSQSSPSSVSSTGQSMHLGYISDNT